MYTEPEKLTGPRPMPDTVAGCVEMEQYLTERIISLDATLADARVSARVQGVYADPSWFHRANVALKHLKHDRQRVVHHVAQLRKADRVSASKGFNQVLLDVLREKVGDVMFQNCVKIATERLQ